MSFFNTLVLVGMFFLSLSVMASPSIKSFAIIDTECKLAYGSHSDSKLTVKVEEVSLKGGEKPFRCSWKEERHFLCLSTRHKRESIFDLTSDDANRLALEYAGAKNAFSPSASILVFKTERRFQTLARHYDAVRGLVSEYCVGRVEIE